MNTWTNMRVNGLGGGIAGGLRTANVLLSGENSWGQPTIKQRSLPGLKVYLFRRRLDGLLVSEINKNATQAMGRQLHREAAHWSFQRSLSEIHEKAYDSNFVRKSVTSAASDEISASCLIVWVSFLLMCATGSFVKRPRRATFTGKGKAMRPKGHD